MHISLSSSIKWRTAQRAWLAETKRGRVSELLGTPACIFFCSFTYFFSSVFGGVLAVVAGDPIRRLGSHSHSRRRQIQIRRRGEGIFVVGRDANGAIRSEITHSYAETARGMEWKIGGYCPGCGMWHVCRYARSPAPSLLRSRSL